MASMGAILDDLREELRLKVWACGREKLKTVKWSYHKPTDATEFGAQAGKTRLFKIGWWKPSLKTIGYTQRKYEVEGAIKIHYGKTDDELTAAAADADAIARALIATSPTSTGVDYYCVPSVGEFETTETGEGDGILVSIPLFAVIETTES